MLFFRNDHGGHEKPAVPGCSDVGLCHLPNYEGKYEEKNIDVLFWLMASLGIASLLVVCFVLWYLCCATSYNTTEQILGDDPFGGTSNYMESSAPPAAEPAVTAAERIVKSSKPRNIVITVENKYSDGPAFLYDKREVVVPRPEVVNPDGIIDIGRIHQRFGNPMTTGFDRRTYTQGVVESSLNASKFVSLPPPQPPLSPN